MGYSFSHVSSSFASTGCSMEGFYRQHSHLVLRLQTGNVTYQPHPSDRNAPWMFHHSSILRKTARQKSEGKVKQDSNRTCILHSPDKSTYVNPKFYCKKMLLNSFHLQLIGHALTFHPQTLHLVPMTLYRTAEQSNVHVLAH